MSGAELTEAFLSTEIHLWRDQEHLVVSPAPVGTTRGRFPDGVATVHVITAWNPGGRRADPAANAHAAQRLRAELAATAAELWTAEGWAPDDSWAEESLAVIDGDETRLVTLAGRFGQAAIYRWTSTERAVVWTDGRSDDVQGWSVDEVTSPAPAPAPEPGPAASA